MYYKNERIILWITNMSASSKSRVQFTERSEKAINDIIHLFRTSAIQCEAIRTYFLSANVGLNNVADDFLCTVKKNCSVLDCLVLYQNQRGGRVVFKNLEAPTMDFLEKGQSDVLLAYQFILRLYKRAQETLSSVHKAAEEDHDAHFSRYIEKLMEKMVKAIYRFSRISSHLERIGNDGHGQWHFDQEIKVFLQETKKPVVEGNLSKIVEMLE
eukprot:TRINITY_DN3810_c0_g3_i1.p1 TRINITY_DN3810_c0_g3~~TRINITY_DN3810_c0_g3_i1.p1  ORF type:complete len:213 (+),score=45.21 TRINITY_DN3810_c0_g3_i1:308-946(+)